MRKAGHYESLGEALTAARYAIEDLDPTDPHSRGADLFASNPKQELRAWFSDDGVELASGLPTPVDQVPWTVALRLREVRRDGVTRSIAPRPPTAMGSRVEASDPSTGLTQWFENRTAGLEQGFTLQRRLLVGRGDLSIRMQVEGTLLPESIADPGTIRFADSDGRDILEYSGLRAWDATGRDLAARIELDHQSVLLVVSDAGAQYPITVDPLFTNIEARLVPETTADDLFGIAVGLTGNTAFIGAAQDDTAAGVQTGSVHMFERTGTKWQWLGRLTPDNARPGDSFGEAIAVAGDTAVIGAPGLILTDFAALAFEGSPGRAFVYQRNETTWEQQAELNQPDGEIEDFFGLAVAISGDTAVVGALLDDHAAGMDAGSAHVFVRNGQGWEYEDRLLATGGLADDRFGTSVAVSGDSAVVGAIGYDSGIGANGGEESGAAYVFVRSGGNWTQEAQLLSTDIEWGDFFGRSVAISGDTILVGSPYTEFMGGAYIFTRSGTTWTQRRKLKSSSQLSDDRFGSSVALENGTAVVSALGSAGDFLSLPFPGSVEVFVGADATWNSQGRFGTPGGETDDGFGISLALSGDTVLAGAPTADTTADIDTGTAYAFVRNGTIWSLEAQLITSDSADLFGSVALDEGTAIIGAPLADTPDGENTGSAYVFEREDEVWTLKSRIVPDDPTPNTWFGTEIALSSGTAIIAAPFDLGNAGSAYVFTSGELGWSQQQKLFAPDGSAMHWFGSSVGIDGETAVVGAAQLLPTFPTAGNGRVYAWVRSGTTWSLEDTLTASDGAFGDGFGASVAISGETILIGAPQDDTPAGADAGSAYIFTRSGTHWLEQTKLTAPDAAAGDSFGSVALDGNTAVIGAYLDDAGAGSAHVFEGSGADWNHTIQLTTPDREPGDNFGFSVAVSDEMALVGAWQDDTSVGANAGSAHLYRKEGVFWNPAARLTAGLLASPNDQFASQVALSENMALIGASLDDTTSGPSSGGAAYAIQLGDLPEITQPPLSRTVPLATPRPSVTFAATATGFAPLQYQWRKDGVNIPGESGELVGGTTSFTIQNVELTDAGLYDVVISNVGGTVTSAPATLAVNALSDFNQPPPALPPAAQGFVLVNLTPSDIGGAWRFVGEQQWRASGIPVGGLTTGDRAIEFRPVPGYNHPPAETVSVVSGGAATLVNRSYYTAGATRTGGINVTLKPDDIANPGLPVADRAQWRFLGEDGTAWRDSGTTVTGLVPGNYLIECKPLVGRETPAPANVAVEDGQTPAPILTYFLEDAQAASTPTVLPFETVTTSTGLPYAFVGQLRSDVGSGTAFVVKPRVVATAGHVLFDDGTLSAVTGLQWLFQRDRGSYEPEPQTPRGFYLFDGYSAQRTAEGTPGSSSPASQELDVGALYFDEPAGRGGFGGFLASDAAPNEWISSDDQKILVGYPLDGVAADKVGRMHATAPANVSFTPGGSPHTYTTSDISSSGGSSGGPLCVQFEGGSYYPAAIYLGGTGQTVVRVIDSEVIRLFDAAEDSAATGNNNTGGGITLTNVTPIATPADPGVLQVVIEPEAARLAGGAWRLLPESTLRPSGAQVAGLNPGTYQMEMTTVAGFNAPTQQAIQVAGGSVTTITFTYAPTLTELESWRLANFGSADNTGNGADDADPDGDGVKNIDEFTAGTDPDDPDDYLRVDTTERVTGEFRVTVQGKAGRSYALERSTTLTGGDWTSQATAGPLTADGTVTLTDSTPPNNAAYYQVRVSKAAP